MSGFSRDSSASADLKEALDVLRELEWSGYEYDGNPKGCPWCGSEARRGHESDCRLGSVLAKHPVTP